MEFSTLSEVIPTAAGQETWDYFMLVVLGFHVLLLALLFSGSLRDVMFVAVSVLAAFADKLYLFGFLELTDPTAAAAVNYHTTQSFYTYIARCAMFIMPIIISTQTKIKRARGVAILTFILSLVYMIARWFIQQYPQDAFVPPDAEQVAQLGVMVQVFMVGMVWSVAHRQARLW